MQLQLDAVTKTYPNGVKALNEVALTIGQGMFGLLGPNGAGKSSLMRTIATLQQPDSGHLYFGELDILQQPMALRQVLGYLPQSFGVYPRVSAQRLLDYLAQLKGVTDKKERAACIDYCLQVTNLTAERHLHVSSYSGGMKQRFGIAQLLLNNPKLIIVDEPTAGLDPAERQRFLNILREISTNATIIFSTHIVEDIKDLCTDMAIMNNGQILRHEDPDQAIISLEGHVWLANISRAELPDYEANYHVLSTAFNRDNSLRCRIYSETTPTDGSISVPPNLEDVYFYTLHS